MVQLVSESREWHVEQEDATFLVNLEISAADSQDSGPMCEEEPSEIPQKKKLSIKILCR
jgi:hypothetical protein